ncbi:MAG: MoaD/ThiS family protein [Candidatus Hydrogenedentales bacterium]
MKATTPVSIPMLLGNATSGAREVTVSGATLQECLDDLFVQYPMLRSHVYEERGQLRRHVLILFNDQNTRWLETLNVPIKPGDRITIMQAVSGG